MNGCEILRILPEDLRTHLLSGVTTLCFCWILSPKNGATLGFTDHDCPIELDGIVCAPETGLDSSHLQSYRGGSIDNGEISGIFSSDSLEEEALLAGVFDRARLETWVVNWEKPQDRMRLRVGYLGQIVLEDGKFRAEVRGHAHALSVTQGRVFQTRCDAALGDGRCTVAWENFQTPARVLAMDNAHDLLLHLQGDLPSKWFDFGKLSWTIDADKQGEAAIRSHLSLGDGRIQIRLWQPSALVFAPQDPVTLWAGCDKCATTCAKKFNNIINFRGFPNLPTYDQLLHPQKT